MSAEAIVFSDLHFGDPRSLLHRTDVLARLTAIVREHRPIRRIVLLGDILDLQMANWSLAVEGVPEPPTGRRSPGFRRFLNELVRAAEARKVHFVPGNHDYRVFDYLSVERFLIAKLGSGRKLHGKLNFYRTFREPFLKGLLESPDVSLDVTYPHLTLRLADHQVVLSHGHVLDPSQAFGVDVRRALGKLDPRDTKAVARARHEFFRRVGLYQSLVDGGAVNQQVRQGVYAPTIRALHAVARLGDVTRSGARGRAIDRGLQQNILAYVLYCCRRKPVDGFIFGHTHRAGRAVIPRPPLAPLAVWNCGTFLVERDTRAPVGTFLILESRAGAPLADLVRPIELGAIGEPPPPPVPAGAGRRRS